MIFPMIIFAGSKKAGVVVTLSTPGIADIISGGKTSTVKPYTEVNAGDIIELKKAGKIEIILSNFEKVVLKKEGKVKIKEDLSLVSLDGGQNSAVSKKNDKFSEDIAKDMSKDSTFAAGASRGDSEITDKIKSEIADAEKIGDEFLKHTAKYYIYRKYNCKDAMSKEAKTLADMSKGK